MRRIIFLLIAMMIFTSTAAAQGKKILYVPTDNRPVNCAQVIQVAEKLGYEILIPPDEILGGYKFRGDPDKI